MASNLLHFMKTSSSLALIEDSGILRSAFAPFVQMSTQWYQASNFLALLWKLFHLHGPSDSRQSQRLQDLWTVLWGPAGLYQSERLCCLSTGITVEEVMWLVWPKRWTPVWEPREKLSVPDKKSKPQEKKALLPPPRFLFPCGNMILGVVAAVLQPWGEKLVKCQERGRRGQEKPVSRMTSLSHYVKLRCKTSVFGDN